MDIIHLRTGQNRQQLIFLRGQSLTHPPLAPCITSDVYRARVAKVMIILSARVMRWLAAYNPRDDARLWCCFPGHILSEEGSLPGIPAQACQSFVRSELRIP